MKGLLHRLGHPPSLAALDANDATYSPSNRFHVTEPALNLRRTLEEPP
jgi:hypothetical protein